MSAANEFPLALEINNVWKRYYLNSHLRPTSMKTAVLNRFSYWFKREEFWALQGIDLKLERGKTFGLIGNNGAGKSTLLRLISAITLPTRGTVTRHGRIGTLLELGAGFNSELTGRENIITGSILAGYTRKEAEARLPEVVAFAELEDFVNHPVRTYSSGMFVRMAFATEINLDPDILLVDEVLAVGDLSFQRKCLNHIARMKEQGKTIIVVSHAMHQIEAVCDEVIWLEHGRVRLQGPTEQVLNLYKNRLFEKNGRSVRAKRPEPVLAGAVIEEPGEALPGKAENSGPGATGEANSAPTGHENRPLDQEITVTGVDLLDEFDRPSRAIMSGEPLVVRIHYNASGPVEQPIFQVVITDTNQVKCYEANTAVDSSSLGLVTGPGTIELWFSSVSLMCGNYFISVYIFSKDWQHGYDRRNRLADFWIEGRTPGSGIVYLPHRWQV